MKTIASRRSVGGALATVLLAALPAVMRAEVVATTGTFEGVYHKDRHGVGRFLSFVVHPDLDATLTKHADVPIRLQVTKGSQPENPGPGVILAVGKIEELPRPPLEVRVRTAPSRVIAGRPFQLVVEVTNRSTDGAFLYPVQVVSTIRQPSLPPGEDADRPSPLLAAYTVGQLSFVERRSQMGGWETFHGRANLNARGGRLLLAPGASQAWVTSFPEGLSLGEAELEVDVSWATAAPGAPEGTWSSQGSSEAWRILPVARGSAEGALSASAVELEPGVDGWTELRFELRPAKGKAVRVPGTVDPAGAVDAEKYAAIARLEAVAADGSRVELEVVRLPERDTPDGVSQLVELPADGVTVKARFRPESRSGKVKRLSVAVLTDAGIETLVLADDVK